MKKINIKDNINRKLLIISFICFIVILLWGVILKFNLSENFTEANYELINMTIKERFLKQFSLPIFKSSRPLILILNIFVTIPVGIYLPLLFKRYNFLQDFFISVLIIYSIESFQLFTGLGCFEFIDILFNTLGFVVGSLIYYFLKPHTSNYVINIINIVIIIIAVPIIIFATINTIINFKLYIPYFRGF